MSNDLKDILNNSNKDIDNQKLMDYLSRNLSAQDSHELEKMMAEDEFMSDAMEGLEQMGPAKKIGISVEELNRELQKQVTKNKSRKEKRRLKEQPWSYLAVLLLLLLAVIGYLVIKKYRLQQPPLPAKPVSAAVLTKY